MPPAQLGIRLVLRLEMFRPEITDELIPMIPLPHRVHPLLPPDNLTHLRPRLGAEILHPYFSVAGELDVLGLPCRRVLLVPPETGVQVGHPFREVFGVDGIGDVQPAVLDEVGAFLWRQVFVLEHGEVEWEIKTSGNDQILSLL